MKYNGIEDVWNDLIVGTILSVPDIRDIQDFYISVKKQRRFESE